MAMSDKTLESGIALRPITKEDRDFLFQVYASTRAEELALVDWDDSQKDAFLLMQFDAQDKYYQEQFSKATFQIILVNKKPVGRLYLDRRADEIRIIDIALLPEHRNQGVGSRNLKRRPTICLTRTYSRRTVQSCVASLYPVRV